MKCSLWWDSPSWWAGQCQSLCQGLWCLPAPTVMGSTKQHPRVQPGPGSQCSSLQATTGIKSQLHTSVKAKHYRLQLLSFLCRGHSSRGWHRTQASQNCRVWILADPGASSTARALTEHSSALAEFPIAPHALAHRVALGARSPSCLSTSFASHPWEFPSAAGIKEGNALLQLVLSPFSTDIWCPLSHSLFHVKCCYQFVFDSSNGKFSFADQLWRGTTVQFPRQQIWQIATVSTQNSRESTEELQRVREKVLYTQ